MVRTRDRLEILHSRNFLDLCYREATDIEGGLSAPMPGKILTTEVSVGQKVRAGQLLVILEAMKMEHRIIAPMDGVW